MRAVTAGDITLAPQMASHAPVMFDLLSDPAIYEFENEAPASLEALRARFQRLETRRSRDGTEQWLNWVVFVDGEAAGYVQATVHADGRAMVAYVLNSRFWGRGIASRAVHAMILELREHHGVGDCYAVLKAVNARSQRLLERLGFEPGDAGTIEPDEIRRVLPARANPSSR